MSRRRELESVHEPPQHVHRVGETPVGLEGDARGLEARRLATMRVGVGERDTGGGVVPVGECFLANRGEGVVLGQLVTGNDGRGIRGSVTASATSSAVSAGECGQPAAAGLPKDEVM